MTKYLKSIKLDYVGIAAFLLFCITMKTFRGESTVNSQLSFADLFLSLLNSNSILSFPLSYVAILVFANTRPTAKENDWHKKILFSLIEGGVLLAVLFLINMMIYLVMTGNFSGFLSNSSVYAQGSAWMNILGALFLCTARFSWLAYLANIFIKYGAAKFIAPVTVGIGILDWAYYRYAYAYPIAKNPLILSDFSLSGFMMSGMLDYAICAIYWLVMFALLAAVDTLLYTSRRRKHA